jgi:hypothetical protein
MGRENIVFFEEAIGFEELNKKLHEEIGTNPVSQCNIVALGKESNIIIVDNGLKINGKDTEFRKSCETEPKMYRM